MIRKATVEDYRQIVDIWLEASIVAHDFIAETYWQEGAKDMLETYLPASINWVFVNATNEIIAFASVIDNHVAAFFVMRQEQGKGVGLALLNFLKGKHNELTLNVYALNKPAVGFYKKSSFRLVDESLDENTGALDYKLIWER